MSRSAAAMVILLASCAPIRFYQQPLPSEPHALMRVRVRYHSAPGPQLHESLLLANRSLPVPPVTSVRGRQFMRAYRVRPQPQWLVFRGHFFHTVTMSRVEHYTQHVQRACGTTQSGYGTSRYTTTRYCSTPQQRTRTVYDTHEIVDGTWATQNVIAPVAGGLYVVHLDFYSHNQCSARCMQQFPNSDGTFVLRPCSPSPVAAPR